MIATVLIHLSCLKTETSPCLLFVNVLSMGSWLLMEYSQTLFRGQVRALNLYKPLSVGVCVSPGFPWICMPGLRHSPQACPACQNQAPAAVDPWGLAEGETTGSSSAPRASRPVTWDQKPEGNPNKLKADTREREAGRCYYCNNNLKEKLTKILHYKQRQKGFKPCTYSNNSTGYSEVLEQLVLWSTREKYNNNNVCVLFLMWNFR